MLKFGRFIDTRYFMSNPKDPIDKPESLATDEDEQTRKRKEWLVLLMENLKQQLKGDRTNAALGTLLGVKAATISYILSGKVDPENLEAKRWNKIIELTNTSYEELQSDMRRYAGMPEFFLGKRAADAKKIVRLYKTLPAQEQIKISRELLRAISDTSFLDPDQNDSPQLNESLSIVGDAIVKAVESLGVSEAMRISGLSFEQIDTFSRMRIAPDDESCRSIAKLLNEYKQECGWTVETIRQMYQYEALSRGEVNPNRFNGVEMGPD